MYCTIKTVIRAPVLKKINMRNDCHLSQYGRKQLPSSLPPSSLSSLHRLKHVVAIYYRKKIKGRRPQAHTFVAIRHFPTCYSIFIAVTNMFFFAQLNFSLQACSLFLLGKKLKKTTSLCGGGGGARKQ